ncbi:DUF6542 domain-containing protein [Actinomycetospora straminea]|uniref:DUF6542 domain-containing protein n=1 Tax=Actinomycetospora straminea TaxID=663607 RepID=A0ABP9DZ67_9PSEU|nr:DUF6542 domain-containing protein [Actinomycetospora straminea]MDD7930882.1 hypothetical protein [Actinomycetospora straminea]
MTSTREDAGTGAVGPGERSVVRSLRGLRWWGSLALGAAFTGLGIAVDLLTAGELGVVFTACFAAGCILATAWARRDSLFVPLVQPPLLLAIGVPVVVAATGSLPRSGGTASTLLAVGGPLVNAFPSLAVTTAICLALGFIRSRLEPYQRPEDELDPDARPERPARPPRDPRDRDPRDRDPRDRDPRDREPRDRDPRDRPPKDRDRDRPPKDRDRDRPPKDRDRDRPSKGRDRDRDPRDRDPRDREDLDRPRRVRIQARPARDDGRRPADDRRRPVRPDDPDDEFGPGVRRVPRRVDGPDEPR